MTIISKILFVGDLHLNYQTPQSRKDVYPQTMLEKVKQIGNIAKQHYVDDIILLGDVFHQRYQPYSYMMKCFQAFQQLPVAPYTIVGNHDLIFERMESFDESPLNFLVMTNTVQRLTQLSYGDVTITGFDYTSPITPNENTNGYNICVAHQYYNQPLFKTYIRPEDALKLGYQAYVLGHDHSVFENVTNDKFTVVRSGSISRGTSHTSNLLRDVYVDIFDTVTHTFERLTLPTQKATDVFKEIKYVEKSLETSVEEIIDKMDFSTSTTIYDIIDEEQLPEDIKNLIIHYLEDNGIFRKSIVEGTNTGST